MRPIAHAANRSEGGEKPKLNAQQERASITISFHRPLSQYVTELVSAGLVIDALRQKFHP